MSKASARSLQRHDKRSIQNKLERAIDTYGAKHGRIIHAVHETAISKAGTFSERLELAYNIIELSK